MTAPDEPPRGGLAAGGRLQPRWLARNRRRPRRVRAAANRAVAASRQASGESVHIFLGGHARFAERAPTASRVLDQIAAGGEDPSPRIVRPRQQGEDDRKPERGADQKPHDDLLGRADRALGEMS